MRQLTALLKRTAGISAHRQNAPACDSLCFIRDHESPCCQADALDDGELCRFPGGKRYGPDRDQGGRIYILDAVL